MDAITTISLTMGVAWASGINLYAALLVLGLLGSTGNIDLPNNLEIVAHPPVIGAAGFMYLLEFFADKAPGIDSGWDLFQTFIRIPAGALLSAGAVGDVSEPMVLAAGLLGGTLATGSHLTKAGSRLMINTSPEPVSNWIASIGEDFLVIFGVISALHYPFLFFAIFLLTLLFAIWIVPKTWKGLKMIYRKIGQIWSANESEIATANVESNK